MLRRLPLVTKLVLTIGVVVILGFTIGGTVITTRSGADTDRLSVRIGEEIGTRHAAMIERHLSEAIGLDRFIAAAMIDLRRSGLKDRARMNAIMEGALERNKGLLAVWAQMEPNAFDGRDADFVNTPGTDASGRFLSYWNRGGGKVVLDPLTGYDNPAAEWVESERAVRSGRESVIGPYTYPVNGKDVQMMSLVVPVIDNGAYLGMVGLDISTDGMWDLIKNEKPFGTGAIYLISNAGVWAAHSDSGQLGKKLSETAPDMAAAETAIRNGRPHSQESVEPKAGTGGGAMLQLFVPVTVGETGTPWSLLVNLPVDRIEAPKRNLQTFILIGCSLLAVTLLAALWLASRVIVGTPLRRITATVRALTIGDHTVEIMDHDRADEIGAINKALLLFKENSSRVTQMEAQRREDEQRSAEERRRDLDRLAHGFESSVGNVVAGVAAQAEHIRGDSEALAAIAEQTNQQAVAVANAATIASMNVQTVAAAAEELTRSIEEINQRIASSSRMAADAETEVRKTNGTVASLAEAARKIGDVVSLIQSIAAQTNLLALNATIEAARAGEAGKGFAVVAQEVKTLANQTAKATEEIAAQIGEIQSVSGSAVDAIQGIGKTIIGISETVTAVAASAEEQEAATREISRNVQQAAVGTREVSSNIEGMKESAEKTGSMAHQARSAADSLSQQSVLLRREVEGFVVGIRQA
ncbi:methyl-accepting chemotaxis protein (plasmid) [Azospirillum sp. B510]|uniref:methyl-accepting chemotaxis protein n=1 Tax=Azospirillum sp. (strain B510) TaxID=137722 RepID=UPI0001C4C8E8|nr:methyl-accepting chemotaxis protein [Azospirillum sp. B510]BAI75185.1 methyl-accepting chemotaxis protein [Azospirillum sp. B510]